MESKKTVVVEGIELYVTILGVEILQSHNSLENYVNSFTYQALLKNTTDSAIDDNHYFHIGRGYVQLPEANPHRYIPIEELDSDVFIPHIQDAIASDEKQMYTLKLMGSKMGLCEAPPTANRSVVSKKSISTGIQYDGDGRAYMYL
ncbi:hypothetical protein [Synechococcus phage DSL-LC03]|nr:hypothetical protein [Synechococcus phage DSL-LC03]